MPLTIILPPYENEPNFDARLIEPLASPFVVKPAKGGGGFGVVVGATRPDDVMQTRAKFRNQRFLIQQRIVPQINRRLDSISLYSSERSLEGRYSSKLGFILDPSLSIPRHHLCPQYFPPLIDRNIL